MILEHVLIKPNIYLYSYLYLFIYLFILFIEKRIILKGFSH